MHLLGLARLGMTIFIGKHKTKKTLKRINKLITDTMRHPFKGIGKPEPLRNNLSGFWSRRIDDSNRLVYKVNNNQLVIISCHYHYD